MEQTIRKINAEAAARPEEKLQPIRLACWIEPGALERVPAYLKARELDRVLLAADANTFAAAGATLLKLLQSAGVRAEVCLVHPDEAGDVIADEASVVEVLLGADRETQAVLAVGSGTLHDIVRFVCHKTEKAFVSVPTAASVDGFASAGAPLILRGRKTTVQACPPEAIFADLDVLVKAPAELKAAGFGDMLGKYTSLADWRFSREAGEPFSQYAYDLTRDALQLCVARIDAIAEGSAAGVKALMESLILSGLSMLICGHSRAASGGEHHVSHYWEMAFIREGKRQRLHGAKVGVATLSVASLYRNLQSAGLPIPTEMFREIPEPSRLQAWLEKAGAPTGLAGLGISRESAIEAMENAHRVRDRFTGLKYRNEYRPDVPYMLF